ncbi:MmgE/PrpD family protein [Halolamina sp. C58]|uniref:MmgE/PrpD family protein n=1 Tax=Halolamina sp. C58 TaxID=3421640 RepID=UPI003EC06B4A
MRKTEQLATFTADIAFEDIPEDAVDELKKRVLDSIGIAVGAMDAETPNAIGTTVTEFDRSGPCRLWGIENHVAPEQAAMYNTSLTRYLDFMDSFLAPGETPHPSDNIGACVAAAESEEATGQELLEAIGVAYEIQGELAWNAPVRDRGWDHVTHTVITAACGAGKALGLTHEQLQDAIGIAGTAHNALRVTRTGGINEWKGVASANAARNGVYACLLARNGMEGPRDLFEGQKGWQQVIADDFEMECSTEIDRVHDVMTKRYVAETYAQSAVEGIIELAETHDLTGDEVARIHLDTFHGAKLIIGGGEGNRHEVETKAQADHSLPYMLAAALLDRELTNEAYDPERIQSDDVQRLLRRVEVTEDETLTERFEGGEMPAAIDVELENGTVHHVEKDAFNGHPNSSMSWAQVEEKFVTMTADRYDEGHREEIVDVVRNLENHDVTTLTALIE